jgi:hypothetical protein
MAQARTISGPELRARIDKLGLTYTAAAEALGLTMDGLHKQMRGARCVSRQTEIILERLEGDRRAARHRRQGERPLERQARPRKGLAQYLYPTVPRRK